MGGVRKAVQHTPPAIHCEVMVDTDPVRAFEVFTAIGRWWPLSVRNVLGAGGTVAFVDGELVERSADGETALWGRVTRWAPGVAVALTWQPGRWSEQPGRLKIAFAQAGSKSLVTLEHSGWEGYGDPFAARNDYNEGWPRVLALYRDEVNGGAHERV